MKHISWEASFDHFFVITVFIIIVFSREWPNKIYTISYVLYPLIGTLVTVIVGAIVSLLTGKFPFSG